MHDERRGVMCSIAPPDLLARLAESGTVEQREAAIRTLAASASMRIATQVLRQGAADASTLATHLGVAAPPERRTVCDVEHGGRSALPGRRVRGEGDAASGDAAVDEAYDGTGQTHAFFADVFGRNSIDDAGMGIVSSVHYGVLFDNAFWNGLQMVFGDGSGRIFVDGAFTRALDIVAHELTHGITQFTAGLGYRSETGALNESFSDVFGSLVKQHRAQLSASAADWLIGAGALAPGLGGGALRSLKSPGQAYAGDPQAAHMRDYADLPDDNDPRNDNGGVHINSGIQNRAVYLAATAIGGYAWEKTGLMWYVTLSERLEPTSGFRDAADATIDVAAERYGDDSLEHAAVVDAWRQVGVLERPVAHPAEPPLRKITVTVLRGGGIGPATGLQPTEISARRSPRTTPGPSRRRSTRRTCSRSSHDTTYSPSIPMICCTSFASRTRARRACSR